MISAMLKKIDELEKQNAELEAENKNLREALKQARDIADNYHWTTQEFADYLGITAAQLSAWTDEIPTREPDFKD